MPKVNRNGQAAILSPEQLEEIFTHAHYPHSLMFQIAYYTAARIGEVCSLRSENWVGDYLVYEAANTKTGETRTARITTPLRSALESAPLPGVGFWFPSRSAGGHITRRAVDKELRRVCDYLGFAGVSTHSFRRSLLTHGHRQGLPLRTLQGISRHGSLANLEKYLDLTQQEADEALVGLFG